MVLNLIKAGNPDELYFKMISSRVIDRAYKPKLHLFWRKWIGNIFYITVKFDHFGLVVTEDLRFIFYERLFIGHTKNLNGSVQFVKGHTSVKDAINGAVKILTVAVTVVGINTEWGLLVASISVDNVYNFVKLLYEIGENNSCLQYLSDILMANSGIQKLQLNSTSISDEGAKAIAELLKKNSTLRVLELNNNMIEFAGFAGLAGALHENNSIRSIHLNGNYGGALGFASLGKGIEGNKSLRELHLHGNNMGNEGVRALVSGLSAHKGKITLLDLGNNDIGPKGAFHVANYIKKTKSLLWLNLYMNDIGDEGAETIADALKQNRTITTIDLGGNNIHASGVSEIAQVLKDNSIITTTNSCSLFQLELGYNPIGPDGAKALCEIIKFHGKLETLKLGWCTRYSLAQNICFMLCYILVSHYFITFQIGAKGVEYVADALKYNTTLSTLDFAGKWGAVCLARSLKIVNEALTSLDLDNMKQEQKELEFDFYKTRETGSLPKNCLIGQG
ncbi:hypothetical protein IEQ34_009559 [Dendrobium chrysotoxum]|uniref:Uncharacterized protein n=1 Tax=Dendrobium chrysotoxum TaxID=161865 RepID=A0AAV7GJL0_DENCH|nr:hypothetical protein IEQ34_009559 [Dendrobium chrysotoxum]